VRCTTLKNILRNVGATRIDLFSLDVEGSELKVLQTMDWDIPVHVWLVEMVRSLPSLSLALPLLVILLISCRFYLIV
jgi:hypothetical protein